MDFYKCSCNELVLIDGFNCPNCFSKNIEDKWAKKGSSTRKLRHGEVLAIFNEIIEETFGKMTTLRFIVSNFLLALHYFLIVCLLTLMLWPIYLEAYEVSIFALFFIPASLFAFALQPLRYFQKKDDLKEIRLGVDTRYLMLGFSILIASIIGFCFDSINFDGIIAIVILYLIPVISFLFFQNLKNSSEVIISGNGIRIKGLTNLIKNNNLLIAYPVNVSTDNINASSTYEIRLKLDHVPKGNSKLNIRDDTVIIKPDRYHYTAKELLAKIEKYGFNIGKGVYETWSTKKIKLFF